MIPPIFNDENHQKAFDENGFIKLPLLSEKDIEQLHQLFFKFHPTINENSFGASSFLHNKEKKMEIIDTLFPIFSPYFNEIFKDYTYFGSSYLFKTKGKKSDLAPHQDWSIVDEKKFVAINVWVPLIDTNEKNGTLYVVPKSQAQKQFVIRAPTVPFYFEKYYDTVKKCGIPTNAKAGEAIILNQSLIHYSSANLVDNLRIAITSGIKSKQNPMLFYYKNEHNEIEQYEMPDDFLLDFGDFGKEIYERPKKGKFIQLVSESNFKYSKEAFLNSFGKNTKNISFLSAIKNWITK